MSMLTVFAQYRSLLDQLPERGFYVFFLKHGYSMILPMKAIDARWRRRRRCPSGPSTPR